MTEEAPKSRAVQILEATASNYLRQFLQILVFLLLTPYIVLKVGKEDFGLWMLIQAMIGLTAVLDLGFSTSVVKSVADARGRGDKKGLGHLTATLFWVYAVLGMLLMGLALLAAPGLVGTFGLTGNHAIVAPYVFLLIAARAAFELPLGMFVVVLVGHQQQVLSNLVRLSGTLAYAGLAVWVLSTRPSLEALSWVSLGTGVGTNLVALGLCLTRLPAVKISPRFFRWSKVKEVSGLSVYFFLIHISLLIATRVDTLIVKLFLPLSAVAYYSIAMRVTDQAWILCRQLTTALTPLLAELKGAGEEKSIQSVLQKGTQLTVALAVPVLMGLFWLADDLVHAWMGEGFAAAVTPLRLLLASAMVGVIHGNAENVLSMTGHHRYLAGSMLAGQGVNLVLTVLLTYLMGLPGTALATLMASLFMYWSFICRKIEAVYGLGYFEFYRMALGSVLPATAMMCLFLWGVGLLFSQPDLWTVLAMEAGACIVFFCGFYWLGLSCAERDWYKERIGRIMSRLKGSNKMPVERHL